MKKLFYLTIGLLIMALGCQMNNKLSDDEKDSIVEAVKKRSDQFWIIDNKTINEESYEKMLSFFNENQSQVWQTEPVWFNFNLNIINNKEDFENTIKNIVNSRTGTNVTMLERYFSVLSRDIVLEVQKGDYTVDRKDGTIAGPFTMVNSLVWVNDDGEWVMLHGHESWEQKGE